ncbi:MAG: DEAD/DEAH box helicase family protein [Candidatus Hodarchaeota archaeon]
MPKTIKGPIFEEYLKLLYEGNGRFVRLQGGRGDVGGDLLLYHPKTIDKVAFIVQAKNQAIPLKYDDTLVELKKFEEKGQKKYNCTFYKLVSINGHVTEAKKLSRFHMILHDWKYIEELIENYNPEGLPEPKINLFPHNQGSYDKTIRLFDTHKKVCVIQATGTGKSYLIGKLVADNIEKNTIILAPSHYILNQLDRDFHFVFSNSELKTYAKLARYSYKDLKE